MRNRIITDNVITVSRRALKKEKGVVVLPLEEYKRFLKYEMEKEYIDILVEEGLKEEEEGKTETMEGFLKREYPELYGTYKG